MSRRIFFWFPFVVLLGLLTACPGFAEEEKPGIVVWKLQANEGVKEADVNLISNFVANQVAKYSEAKVISEADIFTILKGEETRQKCGVNDTSCVAEIGAALGVPEAVAGDVGKIGSFWMLNLRRINVQTAEVIGRSSRNLEGSVDELIRSLPEAVAELFGKAKPEPAEEAVSVQEMKVGQTVEPSMTTMEKAAYGTFFSGVGFVVLGGIAHWQMDEAKTDGAAGDTGAESRHATWKGVAATGYALGGALMVTGAVLWIVDATGSGEGSGDMGLQFGVAPTEDGFSAGIMGRW